MPRSRTRKQVVRRTKRTMRKSRSTRRRSMRGGKCCGSGNCGHNKQGGARNHNKEQGHGHQHGGQCSARNKNQGGGQCSARNKNQGGGQCGARKTQGGGQCGARKRQGGGGCGGTHNKKNPQNGGRMGNHPHPKPHPRR
jgi:hypothetical protein